MLRCPLEFNPIQTLWICGRELHRPHTHSADDYDNPKKSKKGHFYFGKQGTFLLWVDIHAPAPEMEVYLPETNNRPEYLCEFWLPIVKI